MAQLCNAIDPRVLIEREGLRECAGYDVSLGTHTTFRIGGIARVMFAPRTEEELVKCLRLCRKCGLQPKILGGGSNLLISKDVLPSVISLGKLRESRFEGEMIYASAGAPLAYLVKESVRRGLQGMEALTGIPGTVGGALAGNAGGSWGGKLVAIGDLVEEVKILDEHAVMRRVPRSAIDFSYRHSSLSDYIIVSAAFRLKTSSPREMEERYHSAMLKKAEAQPLGSKSAGCIFKNPPGHSAWKLIQEAGLVGKKIGAAMVSNKHANFIVNLGGAKAAEVIDLIEIIRAQVRKICGVDLALEVKIW